MTEPQEEKDHSNDPDFKQGYMEAFIFFMLYERGGKLTLTKEQLEKYIEIAGSETIGCKWDKKTKSWIMQLDEKYQTKKVLVKVPGRKRRKIYRPKGVLVPGLITAN